MKPVINVIDVRNIHETSIKLRANDETLTGRRACFIASCMVLDSSIDVDTANSLRPYGGLIGVDNSRLDLYLKRSKILRLHAALHDSAGFVKEHSGIGPGYAYAIGCPINSCLAGHVTGIAFCTFIKLRYKNLFRNLQC